MTFSRSKNVSVKKDDGIIIDDDIDLDSMANIPNLSIPLMEPLRPNTIETPKKILSPKKVVTPSKELPTNQPETPKKPSNYQEYLKRKASTPTEYVPLNREIPTSSSNCLEGKTFVITGEMSALSREDAEDIVKRNGGKISTSVSGRTSFMVVGDNPGPSKMEKAEKFSIPKLDRDAFLDLIDSLIPLTTNSSPKITKLDVPVLVNKSVLKQQQQQQLPSLPQENQTMWTDRYAPQSSSELLGNPGNYSKLLEFLSSWPKKGSLKEANPLCCLISGAPGTGKTSAVRLACKELGMDSIEFNASDCRSKKALHSTVKEILSSGVKVESFFKASLKRKNVLVMDEVDGMSSGDRGGMAELLNLIKSNRNIPIVCICNDASSPKVRSLLNYALDLRWRRPEARTIQKRLMDICQKEGLSVSPSALDDLVLRTQGDIRQILMILSSYSLTHSSMSYDEAKGESLSSLKDFDKGPFDVVPGLLGGGAFQGGTSKLQDKIDRYFVDSSLIPLMIQENYLKASPSSIRMSSSNEGIYISYSKSNPLTPFFKAADSISESDSYESLIRGSNQEWSLSPLHAVMSVVRPSYIIHGSMNSRIDFPSWLGQNSKSGKLHRYLAELYRHTFLVLNCSSIFSLRLDYLPVLASSIISSLCEGFIDVAINLMDSYCLCRGDVDLLLELMLSPVYDLSSYAKIPTSVKSSFTRKYNASSHLLPYSIGATTTLIKRIDVEGGLVEGEGEGEVEDSGEGIDEDIDDNDDNNNGNNDLSKDKMIVIKTKPLTKKSKIK